MAKLPVATLQGLLVEAGDLTDALPGGWIGGGGEDHAEVEEDCLNRIHGLIPIVGEIREEAISMKV
jgi:hypothetical protein